MTRAKIATAPAGPRNDGRKGNILFESVWIVFFFVGLISGVHIAVMRYWNHKIAEGEKTRLKYDGEFRWHYDPTVDDE